MFAIGEKAPVKNRRLQHGNLQLRDELFEVIGNDTVFKQIVKQHGYRINHDGFHLVGRQHGRALLKFTHHVGKSASRRTTQVYRHAGRQAKCANLQLA